jgi:hypothetical protein
VHRKTGAERGVDNAQQIGLKGCKNDRQEETESDKDREPEYDIEKVKEKLD